MALRLPARVQRGRRNRSQANRPSAEPLQLMGSYVKPKTRRCTFGEQIRPENLAGNPIYKIVYIGPRYSLQISSYPDEKAGRAGEIRTRDLLHPKQAR